MTKMRGEVPFPNAGKGAFFMFSLSEVVAFQTEHGDDFFEKVEIAVRNGVAPLIVECIKVGLKRRGADDKPERIVEDIDDLPFHFKEAAKSVLDAVSLAITNETYDDLMEKIVKAQKEQIAKAAKELKEAADEAGAPFTEEALVNAILTSGLVQV